MVSPSKMPQSIANTGIIYVTDVANSALVCLIRLLYINSDITEPKADSVNVASKLCQNHGDCHAALKSVEKRMIPAGGPTSKKAYAVT